MAVKRLDNIGIVVNDLAAAIAFFVELGLELEGETLVKGRWVDRIVGLDKVQCQIAMLRIPGGHGKIELMKFKNPPAVGPDPLSAPPNALGLRRLMFAVDDVADAIARLKKHGAELVGEVVDYEDVYRLCFLRGPEGILVALAQELN